MVSRGPRRWITWRTSSASVRQQVGGGEPCRECSASSLHFEATSLTSPFSNSDTNPCNSPRWRTGCTPGRNAGGEVLRGVGSV